MVAPSRRRLAWAVVCALLVSAQAPAPPTTLRLGHDLGLPGPPTIGTASAISRATVTFTPPVDPGSSAILDYTVTSEPAGLTATAKFPPIQVGGLDPAVSYRFRVTARNASGSSAPSEASNPVTASAELLPLPYRTTWAPGTTIVHRTTICATLEASTYADGEVDASAGIQAALNACPVEQVVQLGVGVFTVNNFVRIGKAITLRGAGPGQTILHKRDAIRPPAEIGGNPVREQEMLVLIGPSRYPGGSDANAVNLTADAIQGQRSITVTNATGFTPDQIVLLDEDDYSYAVWGEFPPTPMPPAEYVITLFTPRLWWPIRCVPNPDDCVLGTTAITNDFPNRSGNLPVPAGLSYHSRRGRPLAEMKEIESVSGNTITFKTPIHADYYVAQAAQLSRWVGVQRMHIRGAGLEDLSLTGGSEGNWRFTNAAHSWVRNVESSQFGIPNDMGHAYKVVIRDSWIHDNVAPYPGGGGYLLGMQGASSEVLIENNIIMGGNKIIVARAAGAGSVLGYNYMDNAYIGYDLGWNEVGANSSHYVGSHHVLFEGNRAFNYDQDSTWGSSIDNVILRNHFTGTRRDFPNAGNIRVVGTAFGNAWQAFVGNVLGEATGMGTPNMRAWIYEDPGDGTYGYTYQNFGLGVPAVWRLGYHGGATHAPDQRVRATVIRDGNYDYVTNSQRWDRQPVPLPDSLYLTSKPAFFGELPWPWVDPGGATKLHTLPAYARANALLAAATPPSAPIIHLARMEGPTTALVAFYPPARNGGKVINGYIATSTPGGLTATRTNVTAIAEPLLVNGLEPGVTYTFTVRATNSVGASPESAASNPVTP